MKKSIVSLFALVVSTLFAAESFARDQIKTIFYTIKTIVDEDAKKSKISLTDA